MQLLSALSRDEAQGDKLAAGERLPLAAGDVIGGKYLIDAIIGVGGMGVVAAGTHTALGHRVAIKAMRTSRMNPETADRFLREARAAVSLKSSHVAKVLDVGTLGSGLPYMVMELLEGSDLATRLETRGALPWAEAVDYVLQACDAISEAHALGIVHRDLKPENLFVTERRDGTALVKVLDFGISKITSSIEVMESPTSRRAITHESTVMGSPLYMSPEQVRSAKHVDGRTDIWALGAILFELVAGRGAFEAATVPEIFVKVLEKPAPVLDTPDLPRGLAATIERCLAKNRDARFQTVHELAAALANLGARTASPTIPPWDRGVDIALDASGEGDLVAEPAFGAAAPSASLEGSASLRRVTAETFVLPGRPRARRNHVAGVVAIVALVGLGLAAVSVYGRALVPAAGNALAPAAAPSPPAHPPEGDGRGANVNANAPNVNAPNVNAPANGNAPAKGADTAARSGANEPAPTAIVPRLERPVPRPAAGGARHAPPPRAHGAASAPAAAASAAVTVAPAPAAPTSGIAPAPEPSLRRTDW